MVIAGTAVQLVSKCASVEEFLTAFRTYVHRDHVFVPTADLVTTGRKSRVSITLADGTPVLSGEAEVLSSSAIPQGPYQKPGIRLRFVALDDAAREVIERFERSRSEPVTMPADDAPGGDSGARHDIVIPADDGRDPTEPAMCALVDAAAPVHELAASVPRVDPTPKPSPRPVSGPVPLVKPGTVTPQPGVPGKSFKIPSIPSIPVIPPRVGGGSTPPAGTVTTPPGAPVKRMDTPVAGTIRMSALPQRAPATPAAPVPSDVTGPVSGEMTVPTETAFPEPSIPFKTQPPAAAVTPPANPGGKARNRAVMAQTVRGRPSDIDDLLAGVAPAHPGVTSDDDPVTDEVPAVVVAPPPAPPPPTPPAGRTYARTLLGLPVIAIVPERATQSGVHPMPAPDTDLGWSAPEDGAAGEATDITQGPPRLELGAIPDGDSDHDVDFGSFDDGSVAPEATPAVVAIAASQAATVPVSSPVPPLNHDTALPPWQPLGAAGPPPIPAFAQPASPPRPATPQQYPATERVEPPQAPATVPQAVAREAEATEQVYRFDRDPGDDTDVVALRRRQRRPLIIAAVAVALISLVVIIMIVAGDDDAKSAGQGQGTGTVALPSVAPPAADAGSAAVTPPVADDPTPEPEPEPEPKAKDPEPEAKDPEPEEPEPEAKDPDEPDPPPPVATKVTPLAAGECAVSFTSTPKGATVTVAGKKRGATPVTVNLACGKATASFSRARYDGATKAFVAKAGITTKVAARLERPTFSIKVTSTPSGATVSVRGKTGKTPFTIKAPGFESVSIKVSKPGFQTRSTKVTPKKNGTSVNVSLKRGN